MKTLTIPSLALLLAAFAPATPNKWSSVLPGVPEVVGIGGGMARTASGDLLVVTGNRTWYTPGVTLATTTPFYRHVVGTGEWIPLAPVPGPVGEGGSMSHVPGTNHVYAILGNYTLSGAGRKFYRYSIDAVDGEAAGAWTELPALPANAYNSAVIATPTRVYFATYTTQRKLYEYDPSSGWNPTAKASPLNGGSGGAAAYCASDDGAYLYCLDGGGAKFQRYNVATNTWTALADAPVMMGGGALAAGSPERCLYVLSGYDSAGFYRFDLDEAAAGGGTWKALPTTPASVGSGSALAVLPGGDLYTLRGLGIYEGEYVAIPTTDLWSFGIVHEVVDPAQYLFDGTTPLGTGGGTLEPGILVKARVDDAAGTARALQVEVKTANSLFSGSPAAIVTGSYFAAGTTAGVMVQGLAMNANYHWRVRSTTAAGVLSPWIHYGGNPDPAGVDFSTTSRIAAPAQRSGDDSAPIPLGGEVAGAVRFVATVSGTAGGSVALEVQIETVGTELTDDSPSQVGDAVPSGSTAQVTVGDLAPGLYHWRVRTVGAEGPESAWILFGANGDPDGVDFEVRSNAAPLPADAVEVRAIPTEELLGPGEMAAGIAAVVFRGSIADPDGDELRLRVEIVAAGAGFTGTATLSGPLLPGGMAAVKADLAPGSYEWRAQTVDRWGAASEWSAAGGASSTFHLLAAGSAGNSGCVKSAGGDLRWAGLALILLALGTVKRA